MTFLAPWMAVAGLAAALGVVALHLLTTRRPPPAPLPTARFVPESDVRAVARAQRPTDLLLLALRAGAALLVGAAFARPLLDAPGPTVRSVVALEWSGAVADPAAALAAARSALGGGDALVVFDTAARVVERTAAVAALDTLGPPSVRRARLSPMFVAARRAAREIARGADSVRLVLITTNAVGAIDAASEALRDEWPGRVTVVPMRALADTAQSPRPSLVTALADDPLAPALAALPPRRGAHAVRIARAPLRTVDSSWVHETGEGRLLLSWPVDDAPTAADAVTAFAASGPVTLVAPLGRLELSAGRVVARWRDGTPAVTEQPLGSGCVRFVGVALPRGGDLTLRAPFESFLAALLEPCGGARTVSAPDSSVAWLMRDGSLAAGVALASTEGGSSWLPLLLVAVALTALVLEQFLRRRAALELSA